MRFKHMLRNLALRVPEIRRLHDERNHYKRELGLRIQSGSPDILLEKPAAGSALRRVSATDLHLGCGGIHIEGWCNVDVYPGPAVDIIDDITELKAFDNDSASRIYACHCLEHFGHDEIGRILKRWHEVLRPGGELRVSVPDLDKIAKQYLKHWEHFQTPGNSPWIGLIYGGQSDPFDFHKTGFNFNWMKFLMGKAGFVGMEEYPLKPHFLGIHDGSLAEGPGGDLISLNVLARKPG